MLSRLYLLSDSTCDFSFLFPFRSFSFAPSVLGSAALPPRVFLLRIGPSRLFTYQLSDRSAPLRDDAGLCTVGGDRKDRQRQRLREYPSSDGGRAAAEWQRTVRRRLGCRRASFANRGLAGNPEGDPTLHTNGRMGRHAWRRRHCDD